MLNRPFPGHRRYSITHRAVQRLRELVPGRDEEDDEGLRDRLDEALGQAEDSGRAIRTLDAMLGEPQTLIPVDAFGDVLYAIIKEDTVVTVLPQGHGNEILARGQAMQQRVASGQAQLRPPAEREDDRWDGPRRRWRKEAPQPVVIERIVRGPGRGAEPETEATAEPEPAAPAVAAVDPEVPTVVALPERPRPQGPVAQVLSRALDRARRRAAVAALRETLSLQHRDASLLALWNELAETGVPHTMTVGDLIDAVQDRVP